MMRKATMHSLAITGLLGLGAFALTGCEEKSETEEAIDNAAEQVEDAADDAADVIDDATGG